MTCTSMCVSMLGRKGTPTFDVSVHFWRKLKQWDAYNAHIFSFHWWHFYWPSIRGSWSIVQNMRNIDFGTLLAITSKPLPKITHRNQTEMFTFLKTILIKPISDLDLNFWRKKKMHNIFEKRVWGYPSPLRSTMLSITSPLEWSVVFGYYPKLLLMIKSTPIEVAKLSFSVWLTK